MVIAECQNFSIEYAGCGLFSSIWRFVRERVCLKRSGRVGLDKKEYREDFEGAQDV